MPDENQRCRIARTAAESALVRIAHHYGSRPEFVLLGGLVPEPSSPKTPSVRLLGAQFVSHGRIDVPDLTPGDQATSEGDTSCPGRIRIRR